MRPTAGGGMRAAATDQALSGPPARRRPQEAIEVVCMLEAQAAARNLSRQQTLCGHGTSRKPQCRAITAAWPASDCGRGGLYEAGERSVGVGGGRVTVHVRAAGWSSLAAAFGC